MRTERKNLFNLFDSFVPKKKQTVVYPLRKYEITVHRSNASCHTEDRSLANKVTVGQESIEGEEWFINLGHFLVLVEQSRIYIFIWLRNALMKYHLSTDFGTFAIVRSIVDGHFLAPILTDKKIFHFVHLRTILQQEENPVIIHDIPET